MTMTETLSTEMTAAALDHAERIEQAAVAVHAATDAADADRAGLNRVRLGTVRRERAELSERLAGGNMPVEEAAGRVRHLAAIVAFMGYTAAGYANASADPPRDDLGGGAGDCAAAAAAPSFSYCDLMGATA